MKVTLGGDRLGSGQKNKVETRTYERSNHDLSYVWRSTMAPGTLVPFITEIMLPADSMDITLDAKVKTHPTIGPLFGSYKLQLDLFTAAVRLYVAALHNNKLNIGKKMQDVKLPVIDITALPLPETGDFDLDNCQINPSSIMAYLGFRGPGVTPLAEGPVNRTTNALFLIMYWDVYKNYYANKQEEEGAVIHTPSSAVIQTVDDITVGGTELPDDGVTPGNIPLPVPTTFIINWTPPATRPKPSDIIVNTDLFNNVSLEYLVGGWVADDVAGTLTGTYYGTGGTPNVIQNWRYRSGSDINTGKPAISRFPLVNIDTMREMILQHPNPSLPFNVVNVNLPPYTYVYEQPNDIPNLLSSQEGLALKTYQSDIFNNWISTDWIDGVNGVNEITAMAIVDDKLTVEQFILSEKLYQMLNAIMISDGTYNSWVEVNYNVTPILGSETPVYHGGLSKEIIFQEVVSNSATTGDAGIQPLGTLAGKGGLADKHKGGHAIIKTNEHALLMGIVSITPRPDYSQGNRWFTTLESMDDFHKSALDQIGFQELITEWMAWWATEWDGTQWITTSAGKQPAWINYMTNFSRTYGNFAVATNEMFMTLNRRYERDNAGGIKDLTTYIDPTKYNFIFAETALDSQNFWVQILVDIKARRKMSYKQIPNL